MVIHYLLDKIQRCLSILSPKVARNNRKEKSYKNKQTLTFHFNFLLVDHPVSGGRWRTSGTDYSYKIVVFINILATNFKWCSVTYSFAYPWKTKQNKIQLSLPPLSPHSCSSEDFIFQERKLIMDTTWMHILCMCICLSC